MKRVSAHLGLGLLLVSAGSVYAALNTKLARGNQVVQIAVPGRGNEICVIPKHLDGAEFSKKDGKLETEMCGYDMYKTMAVCPKLESTNPGVNFFDIPENSTAEKFEATNCFIPKVKPGEKSISRKEAKYKLSTSCSYSPSILGYYHMSRILGDVLNVPVAVIRTLDVHSHIALGQKALAQAKAGSVISQTWSGLLSNLRAGANGSKRDLLLTDDFQQSYGALVYQPKHTKKFYSAFFNGGANNVARTANFAAGKIFATVASSSDISTVIGKEWNAANVQRFEQAKEASDMVILDSILSQQDRFGNIGYTTKFMYFDEKGQLQSDHDLSKDDQAKFRALSITQAVFKDNDCGVAKDNITLKANLISRVRHVDPETYHRLLKLDAEADQPAIKAYFESEALFTAADFAKVRGNMKLVAKTLHDNCKSGALKLDLDFEAQFGSAPRQAQSCD